MATAKRVSRRVPTARKAGQAARRAPQDSADSGPVADRPYLPGYGVPKSKKGLLPWSHVTEKMASAMRYWVATVDSKGRPHATPVDGLWLDGQLYFGGYGTARRSRNLMRNGAACIHLEDAMDVLILHGDAVAVQNPTPELIARLGEVSQKKYGYAAPPELWASSVTFAFRPRRVLAWKDMMKDATRWRLPDGD